MECPSCGGANRPAAVFCDACGAPLAPRCVRCGASVRETARFCEACGQPLGGGPAREAAARPPLPQTVSAGRYRLRHQLGEGAKKRVYLAHDTRLERDVALALVKTDGFDEAGLARVRREARAMGRLGDHPCVVTVFDVGDEGAEPFIVSQYMAGGSVADLLEGAEKHRLPLEQVLRIGDQVCQALEYAHERGVIHRDVKPGNVWLAPDGTAKLGDFGLAVALDRARLTVEGMMVGTAAYMAPEQALGRPPEARSDLYALGAMLYEMVTGRPPFLGDDTVAIISQHLNTPPVAPSWHTPDLPRPFEDLVLRLLAKTPEERPASAAAVREALAAIACAPHVDDPTPRDEVNPLERLATGVFVGRDESMRELRGALHEALSGRGRLLLLVGEPGIGKTRTAEELATYARLRGAQVLWGRCYEGEGAPAFWPWVQLIRAYVHDREPASLLSEMGSGAADIAQVVSEVRERLPGLPAPPSLDPEQARFRLFDSITTFLRNAARGRPLVLVVDDLHWADKPSLLLLEFVARGLADMRLLVLGTYRDVELGRHHPLSHTLAQLTREQLSQRLTLRGLTDRDVARFIEMTASVTPPAALVAAVHKETEGNPFFVGEVVRLLAAEGHLERPQVPKSWSLAIPQGVRDVVGRRLDRLSPECNSILSTASVLGREFGLDALERVADLPAERLLDGIEEAVAARVVAEVPRNAGRYRFAHALIRETLYEELTTTRRIRLHRRIAEALEALYGARPEPHLAELAYHFFEAAQGGGEVDKAVDYAARAGARASAVLAHEDAVGHYERALQALELTAGPDGARRCELLLELGQARKRAGERERARETLWEAAAAARSLGSAELIVRVALGLGGFRTGMSYFGTPDERLIALLEAAVEVVGGSDGVARARLLGLLAQELYPTDAIERRDQLSRAAVDMARRIGDPVALAATLHSRHLAVWGPRNPDERLALADEIVQLAERIGDVEQGLAGRVWRIADLLELGEVARVDAEIAALATLADERREPFWRWNVAVMRATRALLDGRFADVEALGQEALKVGERVEEDAKIMAFGAQMTLLRREQGRIGEMEPILLAVGAQHPELPGYSCALALVYCDHGREAEARALFDRIAANDFADFPENNLWLNNMALAAIACTFLRDTRRAAILYRQILPYAARNVVLGYAVTCLGSASQILGMLATVLGRFDDAETHLEAALHAHARMGTRPFAAHGHYFCADMLLARGGPGDRERALEHLARALDTAQTLGMKHLLDDALAAKVRALGVRAGDFKTSIDAVAAAVEQEPPDLRRHAAPDGTVTILFTDIEGSTAMTERLGDRRAQDVLRSHNTIVRQQVAAHEGFEVKSQGDGFMLAFQSARRALLCAIALQRAFTAYETRHPEEPIRVRIGLHTGEAIQERNDFFGRAVILAARIAAAARGGEILVSSLLRELTEHTGDVCFDAPRVVELKGLGGSHQVSPVNWSGRHAGER